MEIVPEIAPMREIDICYSPTQKTTKKIALILALPLVLSLAAVAAQKKDASKKSTESATSEQHVVLNPADLKWGDAIRVTRKSNELAGVGSDLARLTDN